MNICRRCWLLGPALRKAGTRPSRLVPVPASPRPRQLGSAAPLSPRPEPGSPAPGPKVDLRLVSELRRETQCALAKARAALLATGNDKAAALAWLARDLAESGSKKAAKLAGRAASQGQLAVLEGPNGGCAALVEVNCETDFVARNQVFQDLVQRAAATALYFHADPSESPAGPLLGSREALLDLPLVPHPLEAGSPEGNPGAPQTLSDALTAAIGKLGENIQLRRVCTVPPDPAAAPRTVFTAAYAHSADPASPGLGRIAALVTLVAQAPVPEPHVAEVRRVGKQLGQHIVGFAPTHAVPADGASLDPASCLVTQEFLFGGGSVGDVLAGLSAQVGSHISVRDFTRWECGI